MRVQPAVFTLLLCSVDPAGLNPPRDDRHALANGQALLIRRSAYEAIGGHAAVRGAIVEDFALARRLRACGRRLGWVDGRDLVRVRGPGHPHSASRSAPLRAYALLLLALGGLVAAPASPAAWLALALAGLAVGLLLRLQWGLRPFHTGGVGALLLHPVGAAIVPAMAVATLWRHVRHTSTLWRGRRYSLSDGFSLATPDVGSAPSTPPTLREGTP